MSRCYLQSVVLVLAQQCPVEELNRGTYLWSDDRHGALARGWCHEHCWGDWLYFDPRNQYSTLARWRMQTYLPCYIPTPDVATVQEIYLRFDSAPQENAHQGCPLCRTMAETEGYRVIY